MAWLDAELAKTKATEEEQRTAQLLFEECFSRMEAAFSPTEDFSALLVVRQRWGDISFRLSAKGEAYNPLSGTNEILEHDGVDSYGLAILLSYKNRLSYSRKDGENVISIKVHEADGKQTGKVIAALGGKLVGVSLTKLLVTVLIGITAGVLLFPDASPELLATIPEGGTAAEFSLRDMIVGIIPNSLMKPFLGGSILQVLFLACFVGVMINRAGDRAMPVKEAIEFLNRLCMDMIDVVVQFIPLLVFASMAHLMLSTGLDALLPLGKVLIGDVVGLGLVFLVCAAFAAAFGGMAPGPFLKQLACFAPVPFALNSSNACLPQTISFCAEKFGVDRKLAMFTLPVGIQLNMNSTGFYIAIVTVLMARTCGIALDTDTMLSMFISLFIVSFTLPGCPGGGAHRPFYGFCCRRHTDGSGYVISVY